MKHIVGVVLAGGLAQRMGGGDKCLLPIGGKPLLAHLLDRLLPQVEAVAINANGDPARFAAFGLPVLPDPIPDHPGPLAGLLAGMAWARARHPAAEFLLSLPGDGPFPPRDLAMRLLALSDGNAPVCAESDGRLNPVIGLWPLALHDDLRDTLLQSDLRKVALWAERHGMRRVDFPAPALFNINRPDDLAEVERLLA